MKAPLTIILIVVYLAAEFISIRRIRGYAVFSKKQKGIHILLSILLPVLWPVLIAVIIKPEPTSLELYEMRQKDKRNEDFSEPPPTGA
jgi:hypothetical protein